MVELAAVSRAAAPGEATGLVAGVDAGDKDVGWPVPGGAVVEDLTGGGVGEDAAPGAVGDQGAGQVGGNGSVAGEFAGLVAESEAVPAGRLMWTCMRV